MPTPEVSIPLDIPQVQVLKTRTNLAGDYTITVESTLRGTHCRKCGRKINRFYGHDKWVEVRHLPILGRRVYLRYRPGRYQCPYCEGKPTTTQVVDWHTPRSPHTKAYDRHLLLQLINSTVEDVSHKEQVGYDAVEGAIARHIDSRVDWSAFDELGVIGIDEIARLKGRQNLIAVITTRQANGHVAILAVLPDRQKDSVRQFLETIPARLRLTMHTACTDMWDGYVNAVKEFAAAHADVSLEVVVDRFHVAKNYRQCVDDLRKEESRRLKHQLSAEEYDCNIKGTMWLLRKNNQNLSQTERQQLRQVFTYSPALKLAYTLREELTAIFELHLTRTRALARLARWQAKVRRSGLTCFDRFLTTLDNWLQEIANYFIKRLSSGFVEGLNNKLKTLKRRCYGIPNIAHFFQRLHLDLEGYRSFA